MVEWAQGPDATGETGFLFAPALSSYSSSNAAHAGYYSFFFFLFSAVAARQSR